MTSGARIRCYDARVAPEVNADEARRHSGEAVRRLREESRRRIERGRRPGMSHCMLGTMLAMLLFVAVECAAHTWAGEQTEESVAPACARAQRQTVEMPRAEDVRVTGFVPLPDGAATIGGERRQCVAEVLISCPGSAG